jgi:yecA family protein
MPQVSSTKHFNRLVSLVMRLYNSVRMIFETAPEKFSPVSYVRGVEGKTCPIVDEWCSGFLHELALADNAWQPLLDD